MRKLEREPNQRRERTKGALRFTYTVVWCCDLESWDNLFLSPFLCRLSTLFKTCIPIPPVPLLQKMTSWIFHHNLCPSSENLLKHQFSELINDQNKKTQNNPLRKSKTQKKTHAAYLSKQPSSKPNANPNFSETHLGYHQHDTVLASKSV